MGSEHVGGSSATSRPTTIFLRDDRNENRVLFTVRCIRNPMDWRDLRLVGWFTRDVETFFISRKISPHGGCSTGWVERGILELVCEGATFTKDWRDKDASSMRTLSDSLMKGSQSEK